MGAAECRGTEQKRAEQTTIEFILDLEDCVSVWRKAKCAQPRQSVLDSALFWIHKDLTYASNRLLSMCCGSTLCRDRRRGPAVCCSGCMCHDEECVCAREHGEHSRLHPTEPLPASVCIRLWSLCLHWRRPPSKAVSRFWSGRLQSLLVYWATSFCTFLFVSMCLGTGCPSMTAAWLQKRLQTGTIGPDEASGWKEAMMWRLTGSLAGHF